MISCSVLNARWYSQAPRKYRASRSDVEVSLARLKQDGYMIELWSYSGSYRVLVGPPLLPVWPVEPPILNDTTIEMVVEVNLPPGSGEVSVPREAFQLTLPTNKKLSPNMITLYGPLPAEHPSILSTHSQNDYTELPVEFKITTGTRFVLRFFSITYAKTEWYEMNLFFKEKTSTEDNGQESTRTVKIPKIRFESDRSYDYTPFEIPYGVAPVR